jgi:predicted transcriptional regulator
MRPDAEFSLTLDWPARPLRYAAGDDDSWESLQRRSDAISKKLGSMTSGKPRKHDPVREAGRALYREVRRRMLANVPQQQPAPAPPTRRPLPPSSNQSPPRPPLDARLYRTLADVHATGDAALRRLAGHALSGGDPSSPRDLPVVYAALGRALASRGHEHAGAFNWDRVGRGVLLDHAVERHLAERGISAKQAHRIVLNQGNAVLTDRATDLDRKLHASLPDARFHDQQVAYVNKFADGIRDQIPDASPREIRNAFVRAAMRAHAAGQPPRPLREGHLRRYQRVRYARGPEPVPQLHEAYNQEFRRLAGETDARVKAHPSWGSLTPEQRSAHESDLGEFHGRDHYGFILRAVKGDHDRAQDLAAHLLYEAPVFSGYQANKGNLNARFGVYVKHRARDANKMKERTFTDTFRDPEAAHQAEAEATLQSVDPDYWKRRAMGRTAPEKLAQRKALRERVGALRGPELDARLLAEAGAAGPAGVPWHKLNTKGYHPEAAGEALARLVGSGRLVATPYDGRKKRADESPGSGHVYHLPEHAPSAPPSGVRGRRERVKELLARGMSQRAIAAELGVPRAAIRGDVAALGAGTATGEARRSASERLDAHAEAARELLRAGLKPPEVYRRLGLATRAAQRAVMDRVKSAV